MADDVSSVAMFDTFPVSWIHFISFYFLGELDSPNQVKRLEGTAMDVNLGTFTIYIEFKLYLLLATWEKSANKGQFEKPQNPSCF